MVDESHDCQARLPAQKGPTVTADGWYVLPNDLADSFMLFRGDFIAVASHLAAGVC